MQLVKKPSCDKSLADKNLARALTLAAMSLGFGVVQLDVTIVNVAIGSIGQSLGGGSAALQWEVTAYTTAFAALILTAGAFVANSQRRKSRSGIASDGLNVSLVVSAVLLALSAGAILRVILEA